MTDNTGGPCRLACPDEIVRDIQREAGRLSANLTCIRTMPVRAGAPQS